LPTPPLDTTTDDTTTLQELIDDLEPSELQRRKYTRSTTPTGSDAE
jgi:hypothetical protein